MKGAWRFFKKISLDPHTHRLLSRIADEEQRTLYGTVRVALELYDGYRKQAEDVLDDLELTPRKK